MPRVAIVNCVYPPEPVVSAQIGRDLATHLARNGAQVTVLCPFPTRPMGVLYPEYGNNDDVRVGREEGVDVVRLPSFTAPESRLVTRMWESFSFSRLACRYLTQHHADMDVVYANVWPMFGQALIARHCARQNIPLVLHIQDIYPESLLGRLPSCSRWIVGYPLTAMDRRTVRQAARVVVISENMRRTYVEVRGLAPGKVVTVLNWMDEGRLSYLPARGEACVRYGMPEENFTFLYLGNIGPVAGVDCLIEAFHAARLKKAQLVIAGDGSAKAGCVALAKDIGVSNVRFISSPDVENVPLLQSLGHVCLLPLRKGAGMSSVPSKLMAYLLSAKPVLATVDAKSDTAQCIREADCGWVGEPEDTEWLATKMAEVVSMSAETLNSMGHRGRIYGLKHFSKSEGVRRLANVVIDAGKRPAV